MLLPGRVDLSAGLLLPRHLSGDPIIESKKNRQKSGKNERNSRAVSPVSPIEAVSTAYRENAEWVPSRSKPGYLKIVEDPSAHEKQSFVFVSFSCRNPINLTIPNSPNSCGWRFEVSTFVASFTWEAAVLWQRFPDSPRPALIMIYLYLLNIPLIFKSSRQSFGRLGFLRLLPAVRMLRDHSSVQMAIWDLRSWSAGHFSSERRFKTFGEDLKTCSILLCYGCYLKCYSEYFFN